MTRDLPDQDTELLHVKKSGCEKVQVSALATNIYELMLPLSDLVSLILVPLGQGNKSWLLLSEEPLHIPVMDYWALQKCK